MSLDLDLLNWRIFSPYDLHIWENIESFLFKKPKAKSRSSSTNLSVISFSTHFQCNQSYLITFSITLKKKNHTSSDVYSCFKAISMYASSFTESTNISPIKWKALSKEEYLDPAFKVLIICSGICICIPNYYKMK